MKYKIGFRLSFLQMIAVLFLTFFAGIFIASALNEKYIYSSLAIFGACFILFYKRIRMPLKENK